MELSTEFTSKSWAERPSQQDVDIWLACERLGERDGDLTRDEIDRSVAEDFGVPADRVLAAWISVESWASPPWGRMPLQALRC